MAALVFQHWKVALEHEPESCPNPSTRALQSVWTDDADCELRASVQFSSSGDEGCAELLRLLW